MPEFLELTPTEDARFILRKTLQVNVKEEEILTQNAVGRITTTSIAAPYPLPAFTRSSVDGYALKASDSFGSSDTLPSYLKLVGEISMGVEPVFFARPRTMLPHSHWRDAAGRSGCRGYAGTYPDIQAR